MDKVDKVESTIGKGIVAGFVATFVLSVLLDPIELFAPSILPASPPVGWVLHFFVGTVVWGIGFAVLHDYLHGCRWFGPCYWVNWFYPIAVSTLEPQLVAPLSFELVASGRDPAMEAITIALQRTAYLPE